MADWLIAGCLLGELVVYAVSPGSRSALHHFALFRGVWLAGLLTLDLLGKIAYLLFVPTILALYVALHRTIEADMAVATAPPNAVGYNRAPGRSAHRVPRVWIPAAERRNALAPVICSPRRRD